MTARDTYARYYDEDLMLQTIAPEVGTAYLLTHPATGVTRSVRITGGPDLWWDDPVWPGVDTETGELCAALAGALSCVEREPDTSGRWTHPGRGGVEHHVADPDLLRRYTQPGTYQVEAPCRRCGDGEVVALVPAHISTVRPAASVPHI